MKRTLCIILSLLVLCSCKGELNKPIQDFSQMPFESDVNINYNGFEFMAFLKYEGINNAVLTLISPENIKGLSFEKNNDEILAKYDNLEFPINLPENKYYSIAEIAFSAIGKGLSHIASESLETEINSYNVIFSFENNTISQIKVPEKNLTLSFYNFKFIE